MQANYSLIAATVLAPNSHNWRMHRAGGALPGRIRTPPPSSPRPIQPFGNIAARPILEWQADGGRLLEKGSVTAANG